MSFDRALWERIAAEPIDLPGAALSFTDRLARENGWTRAFAERAVAEYRRFAYLAMRAGHEVTPSDAVDQVWHLHLAHTRHYWGPWREALGAPLHHGPTEGGAAEAARFRTAYEATLESYFQAFGEEPPEDVWPDPGQRFREAPRMRRVDTGRVLMLPRRWIWRALWVAVPVFVSLAALGERAGAAGRWAAGTPLGGVFAGEPGLANAVVFLFAGTLAVALTGAVLGRLWRAFRGPRRRRRRDGSWEFSAELGDGDSGCSGCGGD